MKKMIGSSALILQLGATVVTATLLPLLIGIWLDNQLSTAPWITLVGLGAGILLAVTAVYRTITTVYRSLG